MFKNQHGEVIARYVGPNSRNGPPKKAIWVPKKTIDALPISPHLTMQAEKVRQNEYMHTGYNHYAHVSGKNFNAYSFNYARTSLSNNYAYRKKSYPARSTITKPHAKMWVVKKA
jgi:hypothetical protein